MFILDKLPSRSNLAIKVKVARMFVLKVINIFQENILRKLRKYEVCIETQGYTIKIDLLDYRFCI